MPTRVPHAVTCVPLLLLLLACGDDGARADAGLVADAGTDASPPVPDAGFADVGPPAPDAGTPDAGAEGLFPMARIRDEAEAACDFEGRRELEAGGGRAIVHDLSFDSLAVVDGALETVRLRGFAAQPDVDGGALPAVVLTHGLWDTLTEEDAVRLSTRVGALVLAVHGPGAGAGDARSDGTPADADGYRPLFDTVPDPRGAWYWAHAVGVMRALTCATSRSGVDPGRLGVTGEDVGGVAALIAAHADDRVAAVVPVSASLALDAALEPEGSWHRDLLAAARLEVGSERVAALVDMLAAIADGGTAAEVFLVQGTGDELFPLNAFARTRAAHPTAALSLVANHDRGCWDEDAFGEPSEVVQARADVRVEGGRHAFFGHRLEAGDPAFECWPAPPRLMLTPLDALTGVALDVDDACARLRVVRADVYWSGDGGATFVDVPLTREGGVRWSAIAGFPLDDASLTFADVTYQTDDPTRVERFAVSTELVVPAGASPRLRSMPPACALE